MRYYVVGEDNHGGWCGHLHRSVEAAMECLRRKRARSWRFGKIPHWWVYGVPRRYTNRRDARDWACARLSLAGRAWPGGGEPEPPEEVAEEDDA